MGGGTFDRDDAPIGALLRRHRVARGMTQAELAERSGLTSQAISMLERGVRRGPRMSTVELLAVAMRLSAEERETLQAAAQAGRAPGEPARARAVLVRRRSRGRWVALGAVLLMALIVAGSLGWSSWRPRTATTDLSEHLVGARVLHWASANSAVGPLQTQRIHHNVLPASFLRARERRLPPGVVPIVSYQTATADVRSYVASVDRPIVLIYGYNPERRMGAAAFISAFEAQSRLIRSVHNGNVRVATSSLIYQYQAKINAQAARCAYIPPAAYVDYYLAAVYDPYLKGIDRTDGGGFAVWQSCTRDRHRPRGLVEYGIGLGTPGSASCQPESHRTQILYRDMAYLHANVPDLAVLEYWWDMSPSAPCAESWRFPPVSSTADLWRTLANRAFGL